MRGLPSPLSRGALILAAAVTGVLVVAGPASAALPSPAALPRPAENDVSAAHPAAIMAETSFSAISAPCLALPAVVRPTLPPGNAVGATPERLAVSRVPGPVADTEHVAVAVTSDGEVADVSVDQTLALSGSGDYVVYERGPARSVEPLAATPPPTLKLGRVTWAGYVPRAETLAARLGLDPVIESARLPLTIAVGGGRVTLTNATTLPGAVLETGPVAAEALAGPLDLLLAQARLRDPQPAVAGSGLPTGLPCDGGRPTGAVEVSTAAPLAVTGTLGPGTSGAEAASRIDGVLGATSATFTVTSFDPDLRVAPALDPRTLAPPAPYPTWAAWAASGPSAASRTAASQVLQVAAAASARIREIEPYLAADLSGTAQTDFRVTLTRPAPVAAVASPLRPQPLALSLAALTALLLAGTAGGLIRRL